MLSNLPGKVFTQNRDVDELKHFGSFGRVRQGHLLRRRDDDGAGDLEGLKGVQESVL